MRDDSASAESPLVRSPRQEPFDERSARIGTSGEVLNFSELEKSKKNPGNPEKSEICESSVQLTLSKERSRNDCAVAKNSNADRIMALSSLLVHELVFFGQLMTLSATSDGDFPNNVVGSMRDRPHLGTLLHCLSTKWCSAVF